MTDDLSSGSVDTASGTPGPMLGSLSDDRVQELWDKYYGPLKQSIAERVRRIRRPIANESEIALSAFNSLIMAARQGKFPDLLEETGLWKLLRTIAIRKANDTHKRLWADKRGGNQAPIGQYEAEEGEQAAIDRAGINASPDSDMVAEELVSDLLAKLPSEKFRNVILLKLEGMENVEIAENLGTTTRTVQRMLQQVRSEWASFVD